MKVTFGAVVFTTFQPFNFLPCHLMLSSEVGCKSEFQKFTTPYIPGKMTLLIDVIRVVTRGGRGCNMYTRDSFKFFPPSTLCQKIYINANPCSFGLCTLFFFKVMVLGGLYFYYLHQQFTVLNIYWTSIRVALTK